jgi:hypothetical protein
MQTDARSAPDSKPGELLAFFVRRDTKCGSCGEAVFRNSMIHLDPKLGALCLACADLDHLAFLPRGDAALTRRATKHSKLSAKVLQWSRTRQQYERQGILVEPEALEQAETECLADAEARARKAERRAEKEGELDQEFVREFSSAICQQWPGCPASEAKQVAEHACLRNSGRVGRSAAAKRLDLSAVHLAVAAAVRHRHTDYDILLLRGVDRQEARARVATAVEKKLRSWSKEGSVPSRI